MSLNEELSMRHWMFLACLLWAGFVGARTERVVIQGDHGKLVGDLQTPDGVKGKCPIVILCHGFGANRNGLERDIARELEARGIASIRFDFNGHGESEGDFRRMTIPNEIEDARHVYEWVKADGRFGNIGLEGHSQGGVVASMLAGRLGRKALKGGVVLLAPAGGIREDAIRGTPPGLQGEFKGDPQDPPEYVMVWGHELGRDYIKSAFWLPIYETAAGYKGRACIVHGTSDRIVPYTYGYRFHQLWKKSEWHLLDHYDHGFGPHPEEAVKLAVAFFCKTLLK